MGVISGLRAASRLTIAIKAIQDETDRRIGVTNRLIDAGQFDEARRMNEQTRGMNDALRILADVLRG